MTNTLFIILDFVFRIAALLFVARFLLQASGADFYNPLSQGIVKATDPVCKPVRIIVPRWRQFDLASLLLAWLISAGAVVLFTWLRAPQYLDVLSALWGGLIRTLLVITQFYMWSIIIIVIASFVAQGNYHPALALLHQIVEPLMAPIRRIVPPLGPLDLTPMVVILLIVVVESLLTQAYI